MKGVKMQWCELFCNTTFSKKGFTLAEVLVTIGVIGVVAVVSIPTLMRYLDTKELDAAKAQASAKFVEAMNQMQVKNELTGYETAEEFADAFKKYMKVTNVCDSANLDDCLRYNAISDDSGHSIDVSKMADSSNILPESLDSAKYPTKTVGFQLVNGVTGVLTYKKDCEWQNPLEVSGGSKTSLNCLSMIYDINGAKKPNKYLQDIVLLNAKLPSLCSKVTSSLCITSYTVNSVVPIDCTLSSDDASKYCEGSTYFSKDYWAGAAKICGGRSKMVSTDELTTIAQLVYGDNEGKKITKTASIYNGISIDSTIAGKFGFPSSDSFNSFSVWSNELEDYNSNIAKNRHFFKSSTWSSSGDRSSHTLGAICKE